MATTHPSDPLPAGAPDPVPHHGRKYVIAAAVAGLLGLCLIVITPLAPVGIALVLVAAVLFVLSYFASKAADTTDTPRTR